MFCLTDVSFVYVERLAFYCQDIEALPATKHCHFSGELKIAKVRVATLRMLVGSDSDLKAHTDSFKCASVSASPQKAASSADHSVGLGNAPSCGQYEHLTWSSRVASL